VNTPGRAGVERRERLPAEKLLNNSLGILRGAPVGGSQRGGKGSGITFYAEGVKNGGGEPEKGPYSIKLSHRNKGIGGEKKLGQVNREGFEVSHN